MACGQLSSEIQKHLVSTTSTGVFEWLTDWVPAIGLDSVRATIKHKAVNGNFQTKFAIQTADVRTNNPNSPATLEQSWTAGAGERCTGNVDLSSYTNDALFVRLGVSYAASSGVGEADVSLQVAYDACGQMVGTVSSEVLAPDANDSYLPVTGWIPAIHVGKVMAALVVAGGGPNFRTRLAVQTATTSVESPGAWTTTFDTWRSGDQEVNTGELTPSIASAMWVRIGVQYTCSSGTNLRSFITCAVGIRR